ncbi:MAG TPA: MarR family transcriptional regulator [Bacteroidia bacterium]|nr:MarR family transcriptional regulator [Bacteroidia bacterium]
MKLDEARRQFIQTWGTLGSEWGINRSMAQVHALLLISPDPLSAEEIMEELSISRGNANMNVRDLISWNLVRKELVAGDRKEYFVAEKDIWEVARRIAKERKKREIEPVLQKLSELQNAEIDAKSPNGKEFKKTVGSIHDFVQRMDKGVDMALRADENWFFGTLFKLMK